MTELYFLVGILIKRNLKKYLYKFFFLHFLFVGVVGLSRYLFPFLPKKEK